MEVEVSIAGAPTTLKGIGGNRLLAWDDLKHQLALGGLSTNAEDYIQKVV